MMNQNVVFTKTKSRTRRHSSTPHPEAFDKDGVEVV
jgi:hypothetical protein